MYKLFVLDFDGVYDNEADDDYGVEPSVYMIKNRKHEDINVTIIKVRHLSDNAVEEFLEEKSDDCIGDIFERLLKENGIEFQNVGSLYIPFGKRNNVDQYLEDEVCIHYTNI